MEESDDGGSGVKLQFLAGQEVDGVKVRVSPGVGRSHTFASVGAPRCMSSPTYELPDVRGALTAAACDQRVI